VDVDKDVQRVAELGGVMEAAIIMTISVSCMLSVLKWYYWTATVHGMGPLVALMRLYV
jgi:hypothetical protein